MVKQPLMYTSEHEKEFLGIDIAQHYSAMGIWLIEQNVSVPVLQTENLAVLLKKMFSFAWFFLINTSNGC